MRPIATDGNSSVMCVCLSVCLCVGQESGPLALPYWADTYGTKESYFRLGGTLAPPDEYDEPIYIFILYAW